ncbi:unnamed protein product [Tetraodon nigroviridis]|uniref:(spotted green pufferfish) hypothetical protein n=1 Tax=Tetraodon nigroviridis TaxID=99883 RepID=Q4T427_TETNG|nr:unnamed protein product [Tetraodon nigroviridis]CAG01888.1 unnamed protein product [Tetraodon nigroviridis]
MFWKLAVLCGACVLLLLRAEGVRTVTFRRTHPGEERGQGRARSSRDISGDQRPPRGPPFVSCRTPLTPTEHRVLDDNTHETGFNGDDGSYVILTWVGDGTGVSILECFGTIVLKY